MRDTIFAPATAQGRAAVAVIRISGPGAGAALQALSGRLPVPRRASMRPLKAADGAALDEALALWFPAPDSYTGEDVAELQLHGGPAVVGGVTRALLGLGLRLAEPGEFTRRAFEAGRLGLDQAEGVADLIDAETATRPGAAGWSRRWRMSRRRSTSRTRRCRPTSAPARCRLSRRLSAIWRRRWPTQGAASECGTAIASR